MSRNPFDRLPDELVAPILAHAAGWGVGGDAFSAAAVCMRFRDLLLSDPRCLADAWVQHDSGKEPRDRKALQQAMNAMQHMGPEFGAQLLAHMVDQHASSFWMDDLARAMSLACDRNEVDTCRQLLRLGATRGDNLQASDGWQPDAMTPELTAAILAAMPAATLLCLATTTTRSRACVMGKEAIA